MAPNNCVAYNMYKHTEVHAHLVQQRKESPLQAREEGTEQREHPYARGVLHGVGQELYVCMYLSNAALPSVYACSFDK
jgi:hypothetical protein